MPGFSIPVQIIESRQGRTIEHEYEHNAAIHRVVQHFYNDSLEENSTGGRREILAVFEVKENGTCENS